MQIVYGDFESYYDKEYTLKKLTPLEYILDPRWETIGCSICFGNTGTIGFIEGDGVASLLKRVKRPWAFVSYNALFDACILAYRYNIHPDFLIDTMGMARAVLQHKIRTGRVSLDSVSNFLSLPPKGSVASNMSGYHLKAIKDYPTFYKEYKSYCIHDTYLLREITKIVIPSFPKQELRVMDMILKMATQPRFHCDTTTLAKHLIDIVDSKNKLLQRVGCTRADLLSVGMFAKLLQALGIEPPTKPSPTNPNIDIYAFARSDAELQGLLEHPDVEVQALVAARLGIKSTLEETRTQRFIKIGQITQGVFGQPLMPIALRYGAAHTHRFGGDWKLNQQNLPNRKGRSRKLRESLIAPPGHVILAVDASQIEARIVAWLAGQIDLLVQFSLPDNDVYAWFGSEFLGYPITKKTHPAKRFTFKTIVLGLGFQMSAPKLLITLTRAAWEEGIDETYSLGECDVWVDYYRSKFKRIVNLWYSTHRLIPGMAGSPYDGRQEEGRIGPCIVEGTTIILPSGLRLYYDELHKDNGEWKYKWGRETRKVYGAKIIENVAQALDREHIMDAAIRIHKRTGILPAHQVHDELVYVIPKEQEDTLRVVALEEMKKGAAWANGLPLDAECKVGLNYGELG